MTKHAHQYKISRSPQHLYIGCKVGRLFNMPKRLSINPATAFFK